MTGNHIATIALLLILAVIGYTIWRLSAAKQKRKQLKAEENKRFIYKG